MATAPPSAPHIAHGSDFIFCYIILEHRGKEKGFIELIQRRRRFDILVESCRNLLEIFGCIDILRYEIMVLQAYSLFERGIKMTHDRRITTRLLPLTNDLVFKAVYGRNTRESNAALMALLNRLLQRDEDPIVWLRCENPFSYRTHAKEKEIVMDIKVRLSSGDLLDLEMQVHHLSDYVNRSIFYMGKLINDSLEIGEDYDRIKKTIVISIVDGTLFPQFDHAFSSFVLKEKNTGHMLSDMTQIHFLELGKIDLASKSIDNMTPHERLGAYFKYAADEHHLEYVEQLLNYEKEVLDLTKPILEEISAEQEMREMAEAHEKFLHDVATMKAHARRDGLAEGRAEGLAEGRAEGRVEGRAEGRAEGETIGSDKKLISQVCKKLSKNKGACIIADELEEDFSLIDSICQIAKAFAPEYDIDQIYDSLKNK